MDTPTPDYRSITAASSRNRMSASIRDPVSAALVPLSAAFWTYARPRT
jgi:hypothetical protein